jgi:hypothetical protein
MTEFQPTPQTPEQVDEGLRNAFRQAIKDGVMDATPYLKQMTYKNDIEKTEAEIKVLQKKLELLKEIETHKSPVENAYKDWWGQYPELETDSEYDDMRWAGFQAGFQAAYEEKVREDDYYKPKPTTLFANLDPYSNVDREHICSIVEDWLPKEHDTNSYKWNECIRMIKEKLR